MSKQTFLHTPIHAAYECPITGKFSTHVWSDHDRPGAHNSCVHCTDEEFHVGNRLHSIQAKRKAKEQTNVAELLPCDNCPHAEECPGGFIECGCS